MSLISNVSRYNKVVQKSEKSVLDGFFSLAPDLRTVKIDSFTRTSFWSKTDRYEFTLWDNSRRMSRVVSVRVRNPFVRGTPGEGAGVADDTLLSTENRTRTLNPYKYFSTTFMISIKERSV